MSLEYDDGFRLRCEITFGSGRKVTLYSLRQQLTYAGLLVGTPVREMNDWNIEYGLRVAQQECIEGARPVLIDPHRRDYFRVPGDGRRATPAMKPEWLPAVTCIGVLRSATPARDPDKHGSTLTVLWFQDEYGPPIDESVLARLRAIDWDRLATDFEY